MTELPDLAPEHLDRLIQFLHLSIRHNIAKYIDQPFAIPPGLLGWLPPLVQGAILIKVIVQLIAAPDLAGYAPKVSMAAAGEHIGATVKVSLRAVPVGEFVNHVWPNVYASGLLMSTDVVCGRMLVKCALILAVPTEGIRHLLSLP